MPIPVNVMDITQQHGLSMVAMCIAPRCRKARNGGLEERTGQVGAGWIFPLASRCRRRPDLRGEISRVPADGVIDDTKVVDE